MRNRIGKDILEEKVLQYLYTTPLKKYMKCKTMYFKVSPWWTSVVLHLELLQGEHPSFQTKVKP